MAKRDLYVTLQRRYRSENLRNIGLWLVLAVLTVFVFQFLTSALLGPALEYLVGEPYIANGWFWMKFWTKSILAALAAGCGIFALHEIYDVLSHILDERAVKKDDFIPFGAER